MRVGWGRAGAVGVKEDSNGKEEVKRKRGGKGGKKGSDMGMLSRLQCWLGEEDLKCRYLR